MVGFGLDTGIRLLRRCTDYGERQSMKKKKTEKPLTLDLGYDDRSKLMKYPWPWKDASVAEMKITDVMPFVPGKERPHFMDELYRVLRDGAKAEIIMIYYTAMGASADFRVEWPPLSEASFMYFNKEWRTANKVDTPMKADYDFVYGYSLSPDVAVKAQEVQALQVKTDFNAVQRLHVTLTKRKP